MFADLVGRRQYGMGKIMRVRNTSKNPTEALMPLLKFAACGVNDTHVMVKLIPEQQHYLPSGRCYSTGIHQFMANHFNVPWGTKDLIKIRLPYLGQIGTYPEMAYRSCYSLKRIDAKWPGGFPMERWQDWMVEIFAHEFRHVWQHDRKRKAHRESRTVTGKREYDAVLFSLRRVNHYRELTGRPIIPEVKQANPFAHLVQEKAAGP
ncbi:MAG TPA: hypothetical protein ENH62_06685 [Marinobacter sp.]|nr:hypothetical protein [Marinobacter sp.]